MSAVQYRRMQDRREGIYPSDVLDAIVAQMRRDFRRAGRRLREAARRAEARP